MGQINEHSDSDSDSDNDNSNFKKKLLSILAILVKTIQRIVADPGSGKTIQPIRM